MRVLITGAAGFLGQSLLNELAVQHLDWTLIAGDVRRINTQGLRPNIEPVPLDLGVAAQVNACVEQWRPDAIVHLAAVVNPPREMSAEKRHAIEVGGTRTLIEAARNNDVQQLVVTSSSVAYGFHRDNAEWIDESHPLRGHANLPYACHKQEIERLLADTRKRSPQLKQLILRPGTILGRRVHNPLAELFARPTLVGVLGHRSRFVFIWDQDVVNVIRQGLERGSEGIYNLAGDGALSLREIAGLLNKPYRPMPASLMRVGLGLLKPLGLSRFGPEQVDYLRYRPVLDNRRLKEEFGYQPRYSSREAFLAYLAARGLQS